MKASEIFEGENSSLKMTFDNAVKDNRCNQCKLENNRGVCDRNDCSNKSINTMRERFWNKIERCEFTFDDEGVEKMINFIEQEIKKEREEIVEMIEHYLRLARYGNDDDLNPAYERAFEEIINTIKNRT